MTSRIAQLVLLAGLSACQAQEEPSTEQPAQPAPTISFARTSADPVAHGERLGTVLGCNGCHGADLTGKDWSDPEWGTLWTANLTRVAARSNDQQLQRAIQGGRRHDGSELWAMPSHLFTHLSQVEIDAVIAWLRTHERRGKDHPRPVLGPRAKEEIAAGTWRSSSADVQKSGNQWPPVAGRGHALGRYIVRATCAECHGMDLKGSPVPEEDRPPPPLIAVSAYEREQFRELLREGKPIGGRELRLMGDVARDRYSRLSDAELNAVYDYLRAVAERQ